MYHLSDDNMVKQKTLNFQGEIKKLCTYRCGVPRVSNNETFENPNSCI